MEARKPDISQQGEERPIPLTGLLPLSGKRVRPGGYSPGNHVALLRGGAGYFHRLVHLIGQAEASIFIRIYIWQDDPTGRLVARALIDAARRGVAVFVLADGYASQGLHGLAREMKEAGVHLRFFEPLLRSRRFYFGRRLHEKLVVVDARHALVGGLNFADRYNDVDGIPAWLDYAVHVEGAAARELHTYCRDQWFAYSHPETPVSEIAPSLPQASVRVRFNDWVKRRQQIWATYFSWIHESRESISIVGAYFLPGRVLRQQLKKAAARGVRIRLVLAGTSDVAVAKHAERYLYRYLLLSGIEIYEYLPSVLHAKIMAVDGRRVTVGSYNVNNVSTYASLELNLDIRNRLFARTVEAEIDELIRKHCRQVHAEEFAKHNGFFSRILQRSAYGLIRLVLNLSTFYFRQE